MKEFNTYFKFKSQFIFTLILLVFLLHPNLISSPVKSNLFISEYDLKVNIKKYIIIDIRSTRKFNNSHIPDSLNISINSIHNKKFLINKKIVIINNGYSSFYVLKKIVKLRRAGYAVCLLDGGINSWTLKDYPLSNNGKNSFTNLEINSIDLYKSLKSTSWLALNLTGTTIKSTDLSKLNSISFQIFKNHNDSNKEIPNQLKKQIAETIKQNIEKRKLLVYTKTGKGYHKINQILKDLNITNIFYLIGGLDAYKYFTKRVLSFPIAVKTLNEEDNCDCN